MATPISHVIYADRFLKKHPQKFKWDDFMLGIIFPDIRRVSNVSREETHNRFKNLDLNFDGLSGFESGWKFHVWCDLRRNEFLRDKKFYEIKGIASAYYLSYYFLEDCLIWDKYNNWENVSYLYKNPPHYATSEKIYLSDWNFWYEIVAKYILSKPNEQSIREFIRHQPTVAAKIDRIAREFEFFKKNAKVVEILESVYLKMT